MRLGKGTLGHTTGGRDLGIERDRIRDLPGERDKNIYGKSETIMTKRAHCKSVARHGW